MTVTNIIGPLMVYIDRFMIAGAMSVVAVAYYATPHEMVTKLGVISTALLSVLFPAFAAVLAHDRTKISGKNSDKNSDKNSCNLYIRNNL